MDQQLYVQIENKSLIPFFDLQKDDHRLLTLTTIKDNQRTAIVTIYRKASDGRNIRMKQYSITPIRRAPAGEPKIALSTKKIAAAKVEISLSLDKKPFTTDVIRIPRRRRWILLLVPLLLLMAAALVWVFFPRGNTAQSMQEPPSAAAAAPAAAPAPQASAPAPAPRPAPEQKPEQVQPQRPAPAASVPQPEPEKQAAPPQPAPAVPPEPVRQVIYFSPDSAELSAKAHQALDELIPRLRRYPDAAIYITGHCAFYGTEQGRRELSEERAQRAADYLRRNGITVDADHVEGVGDQDPVTKKIEDQYLNRRVEIVLKGE